MGVGQYLDPRETKKQRIKSKALASRPITGCVSSSPPVKFFDGFVHFSGVGCITSQPLKPLISCQDLYHLIRRRNLSMTLRKYCTKSYNHAVFKRKKRAIFFTQRKKVLEGAEVPLSSNHFALRIASDGVTER